MMIQAEDDSGGAGGGKLLDDHFQNRNVIERKERLRQQFG
jgi:hypothetical protein